MEEAAKDRIVHLLESGEHKKIIADLEHIIQVDPDDYDAKVLLGLSYIQDSRPHDAIKILEELADEIESNPVIYHFLGHAYLATGQLEKAKECLEISVNEDMGNLSALYDLALTLFHLGEYKDAIEYIVIGLKTFQNAYILHKLAGDVCLLLGDFERAIYHWNIALPSKISTDVILNNMAIAYLLAGKFEKALEMINNAIVMFPNDEDIQCTKGLILSRLEKYDEAEKILRRVVENHPIHFNALLYLSQVYYYLNEKEKCDEYYSRAQKLIDNDPDKLFITALAYRHCGDYESAVSFLKLAIGQLPTVPLFRQELAKTYYYMKDFDSARDELLNLLKFRGYLKVQCPECKSISKIHNVDELYCSNCNRALELPKDNYWA